MQSPWGELVLCDSHVHFFSRRFFDVLYKQRASGGEVEQMISELGWVAPPEDPAELADAWAAELDRAGVAQAALIASIPGDEASVAAAVQRHPNRFWAYSFFDPTQPEPAERARKAFYEHGVSGLCLFPAMQRFSLKDERLADVFAEAQDRPGTVIFVHSGVLSVGVRKKLGLPSKFDMSFSNPLDLHAAALEYSGVNFVVPHFGAGLFREALMLADLCPNVYLDTSSSNSWTRYLTPPPSLEDVFRQALDVLGPDRLLFGSDSSFFPRGWNGAVFEAQAAALNNIGVAAGDAEKLFGGSLRRLLSQV